MNSNAMNTNTKLPEKKLYIILISCAIIILAASLEVMIRVKDLALFEEWVKASQLVVDRSDLLSQYISLNLSAFFSKIIVPVTFGIYTYYAYIKIRINALYVFMWSVLSLGGLAYTIIELQLNSILYYVSILGYVVLLFTILSLVDTIRDEKSK